MTLARLWLVLAVLLPAVATLLAPMSTVDLTYQLRAGDTMLASGAVLRADTFTFSVFGEPWLNQQWGAQILLAIVHDGAGWAGLALLRSGLVAIVMAGILAGCRARGLGPRASAGLTLLAFAVAAPAMGLRPQLMGMACLTVVLAILAGRRERPLLIWLVPLVALGWANLHGSFPLAPLAVGVALLSDLVDRRRRDPRAGPGVGQLAVVLGLTVAATLVTPWGPAVWTYALEIARDPNLRTLVSEWQPPSPLSYVGIALGATLLGSVAVIAWAARAGVSLLTRWPELVWLAVLALLALMAERGIAWWAVGAPIVVAGLLSAGLARKANDRPAAARTPAGSPAVGWAMVGVIGLAGAGFLVPWLGADAVLGPPGRLTDAPTGVTAAILDSSRPGARLFAAQRWGSWLEWSTPDQPVFVDSRIELFPDQVWADQLAVSAATPGWQAIMDGWDVAVIAAARSEQVGLVEALGADPGWRIVLDDEDGVVAVRAVPSASRVPDQ